ncbi:MAG TPA: tetratricopeptide repeat protein [Aequorivita sp.]|nr:tetratricopeptide repeat protein [Aequorivita sp.]
MLKVYNPIFGILILTLLLNAHSFRAQNNTTQKDSTQESSNSIIFNPASDKDDNYFTRANDEFAVGNWESGKVILDEALEKYPKYSDFHMLLGKYHLNFKEYDKARYSLNKAIQYDPANVEAKHILVNVEEQTKRYASAIGYVNELLEVNPYWKGLWRKKIELYDKQGNKEEATRLRKRILQIYPNDTILRNDYIYYAGIDAREKAKAGDIDEAIKIHKELVNQEPDNVDNYNNLVNDYIKSGDLYNALTYTNRGLKYFPNNRDLILKKAGILADQDRYSELLPFLQAKGMTSQYNYYLLRAAQTAKNQDPAVLYGKLLIQNPGDTEAFSFVFNDAMSKHQYQEALNILENYRKSRGNSKELEINEFLIYQRMGNTSRANALALQLFKSYPNDYDIRQAYVHVKLNEAKDKMKNEQYKSAITDWEEVIKYGESNLHSLAKNSIYVSYLQLGEYTMASEILNEIINEEPQNVDLYVKRADIYFKQGDYNQALSAYEMAIQNADASEKDRHLSGYADIMANIIKTLNEQYKYDISYRIVKRWLVQDPTNNLALHYAFNLANLTRDHEGKIRYATRGHELYPEDLYFTIKIAEIESTDQLLYGRIYRNLNNELQTNPYHQDLIDAFASITTKYGNSLIKKNESRIAITKIDSALYYAPNNIELKYTKGLAFEKLKQYDSAHYYQSFYKPEMIEAKSFYQHLQYLEFSGKSNQVSLNHLRSRHGDDHSISTISAFEYTRFEDENTYTGRFNYAGRSLGKGIQVQGEWSHVWNEKTYTTINAAWANKFFPRWNFNGSIFRYFEFLDGIQLEAGLGYRNFYKEELLLDINDSSMYNLLVGATKTMDNFSVNIKFNNFVMDGIYMYNLSVDNRYFLASPKNYIMAVGSIGTSPDVELMNYHLYDGFDIFNTMVGAGFGHMLYKNTSIGVLGTWYNYKTNSSQPQELDNYRNLYNIYVELHVAF